MSSGVFGVVQVLQLTVRDEAKLAADLVQLQELRHLNLSTLIDFEYSSPRLCLRTKYFPLGTLKQFLESNGWALQDMAWKGIVRGVLDGLDFLHAGSRPIVHGDIRGANIFMTEDLTPKIGNVWLSATGGNDLVHLSGLRDLRWRAPELLKPEAPATTASDIWSFGCTLVELFSGTDPWGRGVSLDALWSKLQDASTPLPLPSGLPPAVRHLARRSAARPPASRPSAAELLQDPVLICELKHEMSRFSFVATTARDSSLEPDAEVWSKKGPDTPAASSKFGSDYFIGTVESGGSQESCGRKEECRFAQSRRLPKSSSAGRPRVALPRRLPSLGSLQPLAR